MKTDTEFSFKIVAFLLIWIWMQQFLTKRSEFIPELLCATTLSDNYWPGRPTKENTNLNKCLSYKEREVLIPASRYGKTLIMRIHFIRFTFYCFNPTLITMLSWTLFLWAYPSLRYCLKVSKCNFNFILRILLNTLSLFFPSKLSVLYKVGTVLWAGRGQSGAVALPKEKVVHHCCMPLENFVCSQQLIHALDFGVLQMTFCHWQCQLSVLNCWQRI